MPSTTSDPGPEPQTEAVTGPVTDPITAAEPEAEALASAADVVADVVTATQQEALQSLESASAALLAGVGSVRREIADFVSARIRTDMDAQAALLRCRTFAELSCVQSQFLRAAYGQYAGEAQRLMRLAGAMMTRSLDRPH